MCTTLHPFICWWSFRLFPCLDWGEECCCEDTNAYIFWIIALSRYMPWSGIAGSYGSSFTILNSTTGILSPPLALFIVMLSKAHLTSHSRMSISRWVTTPSWLPGSLRPFLYSYSVYSCHLFLTSSASVRSFLFLSFYGAHPCMKCSLDISSFLEEISGLSHSIVFLYVFALFT